MESRHCSEQEGAFADSHQSKPTPGLLVAVVRGRRERSFNKAFTVITDDQFNQVLVSLQADRARARARVFDDIVQTFLDDTIEIDLFLRSKQAVKFCDFGCELNV